MGTIEITYTDEQMTAFNANVNETAQVWLQQAWDNKARQCINRVVGAVSIMDPKKMDEADKNKIVAGLKFEDKSEGRQLKDIKSRIIGGVK